MKKCATKQHIFWRSGVAIEHAKPENNILTFRCGHRKCATRKKNKTRSTRPLAATQKNARPEKNTLAFKGGHRTRPTRKLNNELWKHLLQQMRDQKKKHSAVQGWPPHVRNPNKNVAAFTDRRRTSAITRRSSRGLRRSPKLRDQ